MLNDYTDALWGHFVALISSDAHAKSMKGFLFLFFLCKLGTQAQKGEVAFPKPHSWLAGSLGFCLLFCVGFHLTSGHGVTGCKGSRHWVSRFFLDAEAPSGVVEGPWRDSCLEPPRPPHVVCGTPQRVCWVFHLGYSA